MLKRNFVNINFMKTLNILFVSIITCLLTVVCIFVVFLNEKPTVSDDGLKIPVILWWTPFTGANSVRKCSLGSCYFTEDRNTFYKRESHNLEAVLFYGSDFKIEDLPLPRLSEWWGLFHEESPKNQPIFNHYEVLRLFNVTSTFKHASGLPLTLQSLQGIESLISGTHFKTTKQKTQLASKISPVIYLQSDCDAPSERDDFVKLLQEHIRVDSYGSCLTNKQLPTYLQGIESMNHADILELISQYKFTLGLENSACEDYITEKLWRPMCVGSVPIYWGSPTVEKWLPIEKSIINIRDFNSPYDLARHLHELLENDELYESYLEHKTKRKVTNEFLIKELQNRKWGVFEDQETKGTFVEAFECYVCDSLHQYSNISLGTLTAGLEDYGCPVPETVLTNRPNQSSFWVEQWYKSKAEAQVLYQFLHRSSEGDFDMDKFYDEVIKLLVQSGHFPNFPVLRDEL